MQEAVEGLEWGAGGRKGLVVSEVGFETAGEGKGAEGEGGVGEEEEGVEGGGLDGWC